MVISANETVAGSRCQCHGALKPPSPERIAPTAQRPSPDCSRASASATAAALVISRRTGSGVVLGRSRKRGCDGSSSVELPQPARAGIHRQKTKNSELAHSSLGQPNESVGKPFCESLPSPAWTWREARSGAVLPPGVAIHGRGADRRPVRLLHCRVLRRRCSRFP